MWRNLHAFGASAKLYEAIQTPFAPLVYLKMNTGKEPFKCGMESAECGMHPKLISVIAQPRACAPRPVRPGRDNRKLARHTVPGCIARNKIRPEGTAESSRIFHRRSAT
jgi:hypothetical protein